MSAPAARDRAELRRSVAAELDACAVGRDHPVHQALVAGTLDSAALRELGCQQWHFHAAFPSVLASLAGGCDDRALRADILADALEQESGRLSGGPSRLELWCDVSRQWGLTVEDLRESRSLPGTEAMIALQTSVARGPFPAGYLAIMVGVYGESAPHMGHRRAAMECHYGVRGEALRYFSDQQDPDRLDRFVATASRLLIPDQHGAALHALRLVLHGRWQYFTSIGQACGVG